MVPSRSCRSPAPEHRNRGPGRPHVSFVADYPFIDLLYDDATGTLLFAGVFATPN
jgi:hypothetical protein